jgi:hypothetical protein
MSEVQPMRLARRFVVAAALVVGICFGTAPADAAPVATKASISTSSVAAGSAVQVLAASGQQTPVVNVSPSSDGMPGAALVEKLLAWLSQLALWGSLASILAGATVYGLAQNSANYNGAYRGKQLAVAGAIGAALAGLAPTAITMLFRAAGG